MDPRGDCSEEETRLSVGHSSFSLMEKYPRHAVRQLVSATEGIRNPLSKDARRHPGNDPYG